MIHASNITKRFGRYRAVADVSLDIPQGDSVALWGSNGAGKTTLIRCVLGLLRFKGSITLGGHDVRRRGKHARMLVGYVPQELALYDTLSVAEAVRFFGRLKGLGPRDEAGAVERVGLAGHERKRVRELSGGMKQRLALAIALLGDPPVLVLDEVTASLDAVGRRELVALLRSLGGTGRTMLFASHRTEEIATLANRVLVLDKGCATATLPTERFIASLQHDAVLHLMMPTAVRTTAMDVLRESGFSPMLNGRGILVPVRADQRAAPFRALARADIHADDFELVSVEQASDGAPAPSPITTAGGKA